MASGRLPNPGETVVYVPTPGGKVLYIPTLHLGTVLQVQEPSVTVFFDDFQAPVTVHIEKVLPVSRRSKALARNRRRVERRRQAPGTDPPSVELRSKVDRRLAERRQAANSESHREL
jgi:hypothetical protein